MPIQNLIPANDRGQPGGVATLDGDGLVPAGQMPELRALGFGYMTCATAADVENKAVSIPGFELKRGGILCIRFAAGNTHAMPKLNPDGTAWRRIVYKDGSLTEKMMPAGHVADLMYDGANWQLLNPSLDVISSQIGAANGIASLGAGGTVPVAQLPAMNFIPTSQKGAASGVASLDSGSKLAAAHVPAPPGLGFGYGTCATAATTVAKVVTLANFVRSPGSVVGVRFTYANTAASPTLNVNGTGAAAMRYGDNPDTALNATTILAGQLALFMFDGSYWLLIGGKSVSTTDLTAGSSALANNVMHYVYE